MVRWCWWSKNSSQTKKDHSGMQSNKLDAIKECKRMLAKVGDTEDKEALNLILRVMSQGQGQSDAGGARRTSLANEFNMRGTDAAVQEYILKSVVGNSNPTSPDMTPVSQIEVDGLPESVGLMMVAVKREFNSNTIARCVLQSSLKISMLDFIAEQVDPSRKSMRPSVENEYFGSPFEAPPLVVSSAVDKLMENLSSWESFDMFEVAKLTNNRPLIHTCMKLLHKYHLFERLPIDETTIINFLCAVEACYTETNPYHNRTHAADVVQTMHSMLVESGVISRFSPMQLFASFIGAAIHDVDHPGYSNPFMINLESEVAITYNNKSVLESHHLATFTRITHHPQCNIFSRFARHEKTQCKQMIVEIVLGTDMMQHADMLEEFKSKIESGDLTSSNLSKDYEVGFLRMCLHVADVSNPGKSVAISTQWAHRIMDEFFQQGDLERCVKGLPLSKECDRFNAREATVQIGFIDFIVRPLLVSWTHVFPNTQRMLQLLELTVEHWRKEQKQQQQQQQ